MQTFYQLYTKLNASNDFVSAITLNPENFYNEKIQPKKKFGKDQKNDDGTIKYRKLLPPIWSLRILQRKICRQLQEKELPDCMFGSVKQSNNILNALQHIENKFFLTIDLKDFFSRISNKQIHHVFLANGYSWETARILTKLTTHRGSLPQGAPSSPVLANLAFKKTALQLLKLIKDYSITFTSYLDDLTFSSKKDFKYLIPQILETIRANNFFPHNKKIHYRKNVCEATGLIVGNGSLKLVPEMQKEALRNPRILGYAKSVKKHYQAYLLNKNG